MAEFGYSQQVPSSSAAAWGGGGGAGGPWVESSSYASATYGTASAYPASTSLSGGGPSFEDEPPLLEELGIDLGGIFSKTRAILLHRLNNKAMQDLDMGGALVFVLLLGGLHLLMGKLHFGIILGWSVVHSMVLWFLVNNLAGPEAAQAHGLDLYSVCSVVGYCLAPMTVLSALTLLLPRGLLQVGLGSLCTLWAAHSAARILGRRSVALDDVRSLVLLPCILLYAAFAMLTLY